MDLKERDKIKIIKRHPWEMSRADIVLSLLKQELKKGINVLDIGCGDMFLEDYLIKNGVDCHFYCVDIAYSDEEVERLSGRYENVKVYNDLSFFDQANVTVDVVLLLDVVEHVGDDNAFVRDLTLYPFFTPETQMLITVPAFQYLYTSHDRFLGHYRRYNLRTLSELAGVAGLQVRDSGYFYFLLFCFRYIQCMRERVCGTGKETTGLIEWNGGAGLTSFLRMVLNSDYRVGKLLNSVGIRLPGLSVFAICRKKRA